jgi:hypothetical protein
MGFVIMYRPFTVFCAVAALIATQGGPALARPREVWLENRSGGYFFVYMILGKRMIESGTSYRVREDQFSAAAIQVLYVKRWAPDRICASPIAKLHFHQPFDPTTRRTMKDSRKWLVAFIGKAYLRRLGPLPELGKGFKSVRATDYLGQCKTKAVACNVTYCGW